MELKPLLKQMIDVKASDIFVVVGKPITYSLAGQLVETDGERLSPEQTKEIVEADYEMDVHIDVKHANVAILKDKKASLDIIYKNHFPASDEFLQSSRGITRK